MNKPLRRVAIAALTLLAILMINVNYIQGSQADKLKNDPLNARQFAEQFQHNRGPIVAGGVTLAESKKIKGDKKDYQRIYHNGELYSPVTGFMSVFNRTGIEGAENGLLDGTDKRLTVRNWFDMLVGKKPAGATVQTTIVPKAQQVAYDGVRRQTLRRGAAVAIDVKTGAILAMASYPSYDTNLVATHDSAKATKAAARLEKATGKPMLNKAMNETFAPGSSFKIVDSAAAFELRRAEQGLADGRQRAQASRVGHDPAQLRRRRGEVQRLAAADQLLRGVLQLHVRPARRQPGPEQAPPDGRAVRLQQAVPRRAGHGQRERQLPEQAHRRRRPRPLRHRPG